LIIYTIQKENTAATFIQRMWRGYAARKQYNRWKTCLLKCQAIFRGHRVRAILIPRRQQAATLIQSIARGYITRCVLQRRNTSIACIQGLWKSRTISTKMQVEYTAATLLQSVWKQYVACRLAENLRMLALIDEQTALTVKEQENHERRVNAATVIQRIVRGYQARQFVSSNINARIKLQSLARGLLARRNHDKHRKAIVLMQAVIRGFLQRKLLARMTRSVRLLQRAMRGGWKVCGSLWVIETHVCSEWQCNVKTMLYCKSSALGRCTNNVACIVLSNRKSFAYKHGCEHVLARCTSKWRRTVS